MPAFKRDWVSLCKKILKVVSSIVPQVRPVEMLFTRLSSFMSSFRNLSMAMQHPQELEEEQMEKDPNGISQHSIGAKLDSGKPDCSLLGFFGKALLAVAEVGTHGARKYTRGGWQFVDDGFNRYTAAMLRHYLEENASETDSELPVYHAAQVAWNALARLELMLREKEDGKRDK